MTIRVSQPLPTPARQRGAVTLLVALMLLIGMSMVTITTMRSGMVEQQTTGNDVRAREAQEAAEAGLEYAVAWAGKNKIPWTDDADIRVTCPSDLDCPSLPTPIIASTGTSTGETYNINPLVYSRPNPTSDFVLVASKAVGSPDTTITATSEVWIKQMSYLTKKGKTAPPFVINGGLSNVTGTPEIDTGDPAGPAFITSPWSSIDTGHFKSPSNLPVGATVADVLPATATPAWDYLFSIPLATATNIAIANGYKSSTNALPLTPTAGTEPFYLWDNASNISDNYGSAINPVLIIVKDGNCPEVKNTIIYGFIYFPASCGTRQGWGNATIHGSIISEGPITKVTANLTSVGSGVGGSGGIFSNFISDADRIPGTWKDF